jgi:Flp pilus assembly secretin CpaC
MRLLRQFLVLSLAVAMAAPLPALADNNDPISVKVNNARILKISAPAATVIIGNPGVADVTIQDPQTLILTGKSYGQTNLIVLDSQGNPVADTMVSVVQPSPADQVTVYMGQARMTFDCQPICQPTLSLGDDAQFSNTALTSSNLLKSAAQSK